ncbi:hypothetical protein [Pedobacter heparinus]|uniref:Uncharacterized protein n=1 Tax=Pedobacter heparinus (strain ATCC 13125 / DSM 2366 / CIP 104194 / JCM 7457 / NBRC 12017 / NCIMB 9290 / NRRL B-14731 / HIM 762-3) TaxID=485917 RepID=C6Y2C6_PEDHD|nr:hypothetical protein [Pedobacter heparinus]ACU03119.1 conserved hypothetical protein [Pedobacter heparinus DSM 2366]
MYQILLPLHSLIRWLVLISLLFAIYRAYYGRFKKLDFSTFDNTIMHIAVKILQIQFCIGITLYFISPIVRYFLNNFKTAVHLREMRFFGMEHITMMTIAVFVITIGAEKVSKAKTSEQKYRIMALWFSIGLVLILSSIPWSFSPLTSRPGFRAF